MYTLLLVRASLFFALFAPPVTHITYAMQSIPNATNTRGKKIDTTYDLRGLNILHTAAQDKKSEQLRQILQQGADPLAKTRNMLSLSPLRLALRAFCCTNTPYSPSDFAGDTARCTERNVDSAFDTLAILMDAIRERQTQYQRLVIAELNESDSTGNTPLHHLLDSACEHQETLLPSQQCGIPMIIAELIALGAHPLQVNACGQTALTRVLANSRHACKANKPEIAAMFKMIARVLTRETAVTPPPALSPTLDSPRAAHHQLQLDPDAVRQRAYSADCARRQRCPISPESDTMNPRRRQRLLSPLADNGHLECSQLQVADISMEAAKQCINPTT